ncbi:MAG: hypothetical protein FWC27_08155, partial [Firmicutes bacterium]|nr:hypothetical protein [Bacillota bacterium]
MNITEQRALYPWETQPRGCGQPLEDAVPYPAQPPIPEAPAYVLARAFRETQVTLMWGEAKGADGYLVLRGEGQNGLKPVATAEQASYIDAGVRPGKTYRYAVRAYNEQGQSAATPAAGVTLPDAEPNPNPAPMPEPETRDTHPAAPEAPSDLRATIRGTRLVELEWQENPGEDIEYRLYRSATPWCSYGLVAETKDCRFFDAVPEAGTKYYYFAQAVREGRSSGASAMAEALTFPALPPPEPPEHLRAAP